MANHRKSRIPIEIKPEHFVAIDGYAGLSGTTTEQLIDPALERFRNEPLEVAKYHRGRLRRTARRREKAAAIAACIAFYEHDLQKK